MSDFTYIPDFPVAEEITYDVLVSKFENGTEQRRAQHASGQRKFTLNFNFRTQTEINNIVAFFSSKLGPLTSFTWTNPNNSVEYTVRFLEGSLRSERIAPGIYNASCQFIQVL